MIGLDTNLLVRYLVADDAEQLERVDRLVEHCRVSGERLYLNPVVLCETAWVLRSSYDYAKSEVLTALAKILEIRQFSIGDRELVIQALEAYVERKGDFSDHLIGKLNRQAGCTFTATFDRALKGSPDFKLR